MIAFVFVLLLGIGFPAPVMLADSDPQFKLWVEKLWPELEAKGISRKVYDSVFTGIAPDPEVIENLRNQPENVQPVWEYIEQRVNEERITTGRGPRRPCEHTKGQKD